MSLEYKLHTQLERNDIREEEKLTLLKKNPSLRFEIPNITFGEGRQSRVSALEIIKNNSTTKVIWKRCGIEKGLTQEETKILTNHLSPYRETLKKYGWNVPNIFYSEPVTTEDGNVIFSYEELIEAVDTERMFKNEATAHFERLAVIQKILTTLTNNQHNAIQKKEYLGKSFSQLPYGIDLKLANLILDRKGELHFIDFFGPKELNADYSWKIHNSKLDSLSKESLAIVCATREGCILRMLKLALGYIPNREEVPVYTNHFKDIILHSSLPDEEKKYILNELETGFPLLANIYKEQAV